MDVIWSASLQVFQPHMILIILLGNFIGVVIGALPGITGSMAIAILLPLTFSMSAAEGLMLLLGIYPGGIFGGSIAAILMNLPGDPPAVMTTLDGYPMAQKGEAGRAIGIATTASLLGSLFGILVLIVIAPTLAKFALKFGPPEYFMLCVFGLSSIAAVATRDLTTGFIACMIGLLFGEVGMDPVFSVQRFTFGQVNLQSGLPFGPLIIGLFGLAELLRQILGPLEQLQLRVQQIRKVFPSRKDLKTCMPAILRGSIIGTVIGALPGAGATIASIISYNVAAGTDRNPERFGTGVIEGIAAPESANNASVGGALIPLLTLGIPGSTITAILIGAFMVHDIYPGPLLFRDHLGLVYVIFIGLIVASFGFALFGFLSARFAPLVLKAPPAIVTPLIAVFCLVGAYASNGNPWDIGLAIFFGVFAYIIGEFGIPTPPIILGYVLGPLVETNFRSSLQLSQGSLMIFLTRPICLVSLILTIVILLYPIWKSRLHEGILSDRGSLDKL
ncbi:MAG: tripartite tricarboxylate transporter permease [Thermodesulfobacteriota bacterium]